MPTERIMHFKREHIRKACNTILTCTLCHQQIREGQRYVYEAHSIDGEFVAERYHKACA